MAAASVLRAPASLLTKENQAGSLAPRPSSFRSSVSKRLYLLGSTVILPGAAPGCSLFLLSSDLPLPSLSAASLFNSGIPPCSDFGPCPSSSSHGCRCVGSIHVQVLTSQPLYWMPWCPL